MRSILRDRIFKKHYSKLLERNKNRSDKSSVNTLSSVTILTSGRLYTTEEVKHAAAYFRKLGLICHPYIVKEKSDDLDSLEEVTIIHEENGKYGVPNQELLIKWLANKTDLLIVMNPNQELLIKYLCAASNSRLKSSVIHVSTQKQDMDIDLWVDVGAQTDLAPVKQCQQIYAMLTNLGIRPPLIGE